MTQVPGTLAIIGPFPVCPRTAIDDRSCRNGQSLEAPALAEATLAIECLRDSDEKSPCTEADDSPVDSEVCVEGDRKSDATTSSVVSVTASVDDDAGSGSYNFSGSRNRWTTEEERRFWSHFVARMSVRALLCLAGREAAASGHVEWRKKLEENSREC